MIRQLFAPLLLVLSTSSAVLVARESAPPASGPEAVREAPATPGRAPGRERAPPAIELPRGDPFRPFEAPAPAHAVKATPAALEELRLFGTFRKGDTRVALINDRFYAVGDRIGAGAVVKEIDVTTNTVSIERNGVIEILTEQ